MRCAQSGGGFDPFAPGFGFGERFNQCETLAGEAADMRGQDEPGGDCAERAEGQREEDVVFDGGDV